MADYQLYCFAQSGNAYRAALMLNLVGADWKPVWVDFFVGFEQRSEKYRSEVNEMGEVPVLVDGAKKLTQSAVILQYLAKKTGKFLPKGEDEELEALRWIVFDNQKVNGFIGPYRFINNWAKPRPDQAVFNFLKARIDGNLAIINKRLAKLPYLVGERPTIADVSLAGYLFYPADEFGFDIRKEHPAISAWLDRIKTLPGWAHPYDLMPGFPFGTNLINGKPMN
ncbi:MAG: glutathione S-transferase family protein [Pseudolabrys sp.]